MLQNQKSFEFPSIFNTIPFHKRSAHEVSAFLKNKTATEKGCQISLTAKKASRKSIYYVISKRRISGTDGLNKFSKGSYMGPITNRAVDVASRARDVCQDGSLLPYGSSLELLQGVRSDQGLHYENITFHLELGIFTPMARTLGVHFYEN